MADPSKPQPRDWTVPRDLRALVQHVHDGGDPDQIPPLDGEESAQAWLQADAIAQRIGGSFLIDTKRVRQSDGLYITFGLVFRHVPFSPDERPKPRAEEDAVEPEPAAA